MRLLGLFKRTSISSANPSLLKYSCATLNGKYDLVLSISYLPAVNIYTILNCLTRGEVPNAVLTPFGEISLMLSPTL